ncbi:cell division protein ZapA [Thiothrix nivea]|uniref:Cell division protein ZapA n=1 Tax=Thiothrix nivea (strain ATCC 35100 / DSM 5205 / JP2) TaxID=870187 RepID=A0A656HGE9_THINJ|nr:cell division protein ZapA [Thiothrix nivea]EIJ34105.1 cell division protein ZapA [Thiothrix nivea DSM 5205]
MDKNIKPVNIRILDKDYMVACPAGEQHALLASAQRVDKEMRRIRDTGKVVGTDRIAVMVALNLAHELMHSKHNHAADTETLEQLQKLQQRLDNVLGKHKS